MLEEVITKRTFLFSLLTAMLQENFKLLNEKLDRLVRKQRLTKEVSFVEFCAKYVYIAQLKKR